MTDIAAPSILALFQTDKKQRKDFITKVVDAVEDGSINPLDILLQLKAMNEIVDGILIIDPEKNKGNVESAIRFKECLMDQINKHPSSFTFHNSVISKAEVGTKYDFTFCNDPVQQRLQLSHAERKADLDERQSFLKTIPANGIDYVDEETGEVVKIYPPQKKSTSSIKVQLK